MYAFPQEHTKALFHYFDLLDLSPVYPISAPFPSVEYSEWQEGKECRETHLVFLVELHKARSNSVFSCFTIMSLSSC